MNILELANEIVRKVHQWDRDHPAFRRGQDSTEYKLAVALVALSSAASEKRACPFCKKPDPNFKYNPQGEWK